MYKVRNIASRKMLHTMEYRIGKLNQYLIGLCGYFAFADTNSIFSHIDKWIRRRLRMCLWKNWKKAITKIRNLAHPRNTRLEAYEWGNTLKSYCKSQKVQYYTEPLATPTGVTKGSKVCKLDMKHCGYLS